MEHLYGSFVPGIRLGNYYGFKGNAKGERVLPPPLLSYLGEKLTLTLEALKNFLTKSQKKYLV
jgi:hypothetical protein